jgi:hypothetical protein
VGAGIAITVRPRNRHKTLRQVIGSTISIGYSSPAGAKPVGVHTGFTVK